MTNTLGVKEAPVRERGIMNVLQQIVCCGLFRTPEQASDKWDQYIDTLEFNMSKAFEVQR